MSAYVVEVQPDGAYWNVRVPAIHRCTQARTLNEVETVAQELISIMAEEPMPELDIRQLKTEQNQG